MRWGIRKLQDLCKPRKELTVDAVLLYQVEGYELETIALNDIVDVINYANKEGDIEQLRIVGYEHGIWDYSDAVLELSDITLDSTDIFKKTVSASNIINNGTLNSSKVVDFFKNGQSLSQTLRQVDETIVQMKTDLSKTDEDIGGIVAKNTSDIDALNEEILSQIAEIASLKLTIEGLEAQLIETGGSNLIKNSVGIFENENWEGTIVQYVDTDVKINNESKSSIELQSATISQEVVNIKNGSYNISFNYKKLISAATVKAIINDIEYELTSTSWDTIQEGITITNNKFKIQFISDTNNSCLISDLLLTAGKYKQVWTQNADETTTDTVKIGKGIQVDSSITNTYARFDADGNRIINKSTGKVVTELTDKGVETDKVKSNVEETAGILIEEIDGQTWICSLL
jgi:hypothetical protein